MRRRLFLARPVRLGGLAMLMVLLLGACARVHVRAPDAELLAAQAGRESALSAQVQWAFSGRFAVSGEGDGGSGRIEWRQQGESYRIELSAPVTRRSWRLIGDSTGARLEGLDEGPLQGGDAEALLYQATGWSMPLRQLTAWVRGARASGRAEIEFSGEGLPARLHQSGWHIEYRGWDSAFDPALPRRVFAETERHRVRLVVDRWSGGGG